MGDNGQGLLPELQGATAANGGTVDADVDMERGFNDSILDETDDSQPDTPGREQPPPTDRSRHKLPKERSVLQSIKGDKFLVPGRVGSEYDIDMRMRNAHLYSSNEDEVFHSVSDGRYPPPADSDGVLGSGSASKTD